MFTAKREGLLKVEWLAAVIYRNGKVTEQRFCIQDLQFIYSRISVKLENATARPEEPGANAAESLVHSESYCRG